MEVENRDENGQIKEENTLEIITEEKLLPRMVLRVLLVEADDSTRQIISALLRKCSFKVSAVADGLKAWETLRAKPHNIDLILTEVELPSISGYAFLTLMMEHEICKNIPVIMMSTNDSISMVLKCMLKGAADFLIKPVRRNELKNLWQHVWRRRTQPGRHVTEDTNTSQNNAASDVSSDGLDSAEKNKECSEKSSQSQDPSKVKCVSASNLSHGEQHQVDASMEENSVLPKSDIIGKSIALKLGRTSCATEYNSMAFTWGEDQICGVEKLRNTNIEPKIHKDKTNINSEIHFDTDELVEPSSQAIDLMGSFDNYSSDNYGRSSADDGRDEFSCAPQLELTLRRSHPGCSNNELNGEKHTLNHSNASAFSRYDNSKTLQPFSPPLVRDQHSENTSGTAPWHGDMLLHSQGNATALFLGQSTLAEAAYPQPRLAMIPAPGIRFESLSAGNDQMVPPIVSTLSGFPSPSSPTLHSTSEIHSSEQAHCMLNGTTKHSAGQTMREEDCNSNFEEVVRHGSPGPGLSSSGGLCNIAESNLNTSVHGNICGSSDKNATPAATVRTTVFESVNDNRILIHDSYRGVDSHCSSLREAALMKFRLKRKERCFDKKVRYQSRKRLAEQRPRVKGQFVRQGQNDQPCSDINVHS